jgi:peptide/nickel transport system substrate-binding protein
MEASKEGEMPSEPASDTLPTEVKEERPKRTMLLAVIVAVIVVIAAIAAAIGLGLFGGNEEPENSIPTAGAVATTPTTIAIGESVTFQSTANDTDGTIVDYLWDFGDGSTPQNGSTLTTVSHTYSYGGDYWVYHVVKDNDGANASNEGAMVRVSVVLYYPPTVLSDDHPWNEDWTNTTVTNNTKPFAFITSNNDVIAPNTAVLFNTTSSYVIGGWHWLNATNETEGVGYNVTSDAKHFYGWITSATVDFGDGSAAATVVPGTWTASRTYATSGHYCASFNLTGNNSGTTVTTIVKRTIHVLAPATTPGGIVKNPNAVIKATFGEPYTLDPAIDYESAGGEILINVYEPLVWFKGSSAAELEPVLAKEIPTLTNGLLSANGMNYTFNIKTGITFHDGTALNATDVAYTFQRVLRMHDPSSPYWMLSQVLDDYIGFVPDKTNATRKTVGYFLDHSDFNTSQSLVAQYLIPLGYAHTITEADCQAVAERVVTQDNDTAVTFHLLKPYPGFLQVMAYTVGDIVSKDFVDAHGGVVNGELNDYMSTHMCGTGPYKLVNWEVGSKIYLTRNDAYWGPKPALKDAYIIKANDVNTRILLLQAGDADIIDIALSYESLFTDTSKYTIKKGFSTFDLTFMTFNFNLDSATATSQFGGVAITDTFFHDIHVRKAFSHMLNFSLYQSNVAFGNGEQPNGVIPNGMYGYNASIQKYNYSLQLAADELKNATSPYGGESWFTHGFTLPMFYNAGNLGRQTSCEMVQASLRTLSTYTGAGVMDATINPLDWPQYLAQMYNDYSYMGFYVIGWGPDYADPDDYTVPMLDPDYGTYPYYTGYSNDAIRDLLRAAAVELNDTLRKDMYSNMSQQVFEDVPYVWLNQPKSFHLERSWISGYQFNPMYSTNILFKTLSKPTA